MRVFPLVLCLCLLFPVLSSADPVTLGPALYGTVCWPEGTDESSASYIYRYSLPSAVGDDDASTGINACYTYYLDDAIAFTVPINGESLENPSLSSFTEVDSEVTCNNGLYFSVLLKIHSVLDGEAYNTYAGNVFACTGKKAGLVITLPYLLGILKEDEQDEWLKQRQTAKANTCIRELLWEEIESQSSERNYLPDISYDFFSDMFYPEEDFYLDQDGNPVFFVQPGILTPLEDGVLLFPLSLDRILDEM